jgi:hypothetical protein
MFAKWYGIKKKQKKYHFSHGGGTNLLVLAQTLIYRHLENLI